MHPQNSTRKRGERVELKFKTLPAARAFEWYFNEGPISTSSAEYEVSTTGNLCIKKFLPKHKGVYNCIATDESGKSYMSRSATLEIGKAVCQLLIPWA